MTNKGSLFLVHLGVVIVVTDTGKALAAHLADEGFFARVRSLMNIKVAHFEEALVADFTSEWKFAFVSCLVNLKRCFKFK